MRRNLMGVVMALALTIGSGCAGFGDGLNHAITGKEPAAPVAADHKTGYDLGVMFGNVLIAGFSYGSAYLLHGKKNSNGVIPGKAE